MPTTRPQALWTWATEVVGEHTRVHAHPHLCKQGSSTGTCSPIARASDTNAHRSHKTICSHPHPGRSAKTERLGNSAIHFKQRRACFFYSNIRFSLWPPILQSGNSVSLGLCKAMDKRFYRSHQQVPAVIRSLGTALVIMRPLFFFFCKFSSAYKGDRLVHHLCYIRAFICALSDFTVRGWGSLCPHYFKTLILSFIKLATVPMEKKEIWSSSISECHRELDVHVEVREHWCLLCIISSLLWWVDILW